MEDLEDSPATLIAGARALYVSIDDTALARFEQYVALLREWSTRINLLGPAALRELWRQVIEHVSRISIAGQQDKRTSRASPIENLELDRWLHVDEALSMP